MPSLRLLIPQPIRLIRVSAFFADSTDIMASLVERASGADIQAVLVRGELVHGAL